MKIFKREKFNEVFEEYRVPLLRFVYLYVYDREKAKDIVQETFLKLYKEKKEIYNLKSWIFKVARNLSIDHIRKERRVFPIPEDFEYEDKRDLHKREKIRYLLAREIARLPGSYKETFILRDVEGYSYEEISEILDISCGTAKSRVFRAREMLREALKHELRRI